MKFPEKLISLRTKRNLTQVAAAAGCGMSLRGYQNYERDEREASMSKLIAIADFYNVSLDELVCRKWPKKTTTIVHGDQENAMVGQVKKKCHKYSEKIVLLRKGRKLTQMQAATGCGISLRGYLNYEYGEREPSMLKLIALADFYDVSLDELVCREWPKKKQTRPCLPAKKMQPSFSKRLLKLRKAKGLTQTELAEQVGLNYRTYQTYEHGEREPSLSTLVAFADFYEMSVDELIGRKWPKKNSKHD